MQGGDNTAVKEAGLPNITATDNPSYSWTDGRKTTGAFVSQHGRIAGGTPHGEHDKAYFNFDASQSNPIYGASDTVQPPAICLIPRVKY